MAGKLSPTAQLRVLTIGQFLTRIQHVHGLVERYATAKSKPEMYELPVRRAFQQLKIQFMGEGFDVLSQLCGSMDQAMKRNGSQNSKSRTLREGVGTMRFQLELASRAVVTEDMAAQAREKAEAGD